MAGSKNRFTTYVNFEAEDLLISFDNEEATPEKVSSNDKDSCHKETMQQTATNMENIARDLNVPDSASVSDSMSQSSTTDTRSSYYSCDSEPETQNDDTLCGYLNKYKVESRALSKTFKRRWFVFADNTCKLLYYRTPQDIIPLGEIDIAGASFSFDIGLTAGRSNVFQISSGKTYFLEAPDHHTMQYWLQILQKKRRNYSKKKTTLSKGLGTPTSVKQPAAGLISIDRKFSTSGENDTPTQSWEMPSSVGQNSAIVSGCGIGDISFSNWKTELRNALANLRHKRQSDMDGPVPQSPSATNTTHDVELRSPHEKMFPESRKQLIEKRLSSFKRRLAPRPKSEAIMDISNPVFSNEETTCSKCIQLQAYLQNLQDDLNTVEEELQAHRELVKILERQIATSQKQLATEHAFKFGEKDEKYLSELQTKDKQLVELEHLLAATQEEKEIIRYQLKSFEAEVNNMEEQIEALKESLKAKNEAVVTLSNRVMDLEQNPDSTAMSNTTIPGLVDRSEVEQLKEMVSGYKAQNKFLSKEILELNKLRVDDEAREKQVFIRCTEMEARYYQIQSKYLLCLEQLRIPLRGGGDVQAEDMVNLLLQDAMDTETKHKADDLHPSKTSPVKYDKYGFSMLPRDVEDDLVAKASNFQRKSDELKIKDVDKEISWNVKWENYLVSLGNRELTRCPEIKVLIRGGVPSEHRDRIWNMCIRSHVAQLQEKCGSQYYLKLLEKLKNAKLNPATKQIELDLLRTLPQNKHYESITSEGIPKLRRVLLAYTQHNPTIGYCQGLNRLVAIALLFMNEEDAFWCLLAIVEFIMPPDYYTSTLIAAQVDQRVLKDLVQDKIPRLWTHFENNDVDLSLFSFNWFLTVFVDNIPPETYLRIWDCFLYEGNKVLFRFAVAFLKLREEQLLGIHETMAIHHYLRCMTEDMTNIEKISQIAFHEINPFSMRRINFLRQVHMEQVKNELAELEAVRKGYQPLYSRESRLVDVSDDEI